MRAENFRIVNGQLYNRDKSVHWKQQKGEYVGTNDFGVVLMLFEEKDQRAPPPVDEMARGGNFLGSSMKSTPSPGRLLRKWREYGSMVAVKNLPIVSAASGDTVSFTAMRVGTAPYGDKVLAVWDCGTRDLVPVVQTNVVSTGR
jgi:hypothetical protein